MPDQPAPTKKPRVNRARAWAEARSLIWKHRRSLSVGLARRASSDAADISMPDVQ